MTSPSSHSGAGARPATSGTVDNIGAGTPLGSDAKDEAPAMPEGESARRAAAESTQREMPPPVETESATDGADQHIVGGGSMAGPGAAGTGAGAPTRITERGAAAAERGAAEAARDAQKKRDDAA